MVDFEVQRCTRKCAKSERELKPGEAYFSVLVDEEGEMVRHDYSVESWHGPPEDAVGWWKSQMPDDDAKKANLAPNEVLMHYFHAMQEAEGQENLLYILTLLMVRKKLLRLDAIEKADAGEFLVVWTADGDSDFRILVTEPTADEVAAIQQELGRLLFADAA